MDEELRQLFAVLNSEVRYCLLRGADRLLDGLREHDIDLLVDHRDLTRLTRVLRHLGFSAVPAWQHEPHHFFRKYTRDTGEWTTLDVVPEICFGRLVRYLILGSEDFLRRRTYREGIYTLELADEALLLLFHCILDKRDFPPKHRIRLRQLAAQLQEGCDDHTCISATAEHVKAYLPSPYRWQYTAESVLSEKWDTLLMIRTDITRHVLWRDPLGCGLRFLYRVAVKKAFGPILRAKEGRGMYIALLSPDGGGKTTLARALNNDCQIRARVIYMGDNAQSSTIGLPWMPALESIDKSGPPVRALYFFSRLLQQWVRLAVARLHSMRGKNVVFDRYVYDQWLRDTPKSWGKRMRRKLLGYGWPKPDLVVMLDAPGTVLYERKHEHHPEYLERQRNRYLELQGKIPNFIRLDATREEREVLSELTSIIWALYTRRDLPNATVKS
jgi:thymidylate kinase